jgi:hypothetical protein
MIFFRLDSKSGETPRKVLGRKDGAEPQIEIFYHPLTSTSETLLLDKRLIQDSLCTSEIFFPQKFVPINLSFEKNDQT